MMMKDIPILVWLVPIAVLGIAILQMPYGYYVFTRAVTCAAAVLIVVTDIKERQKLTVWSVLFVLMAILFNPVLPIYLPRQTWFYFDLIAACTFAIHITFVRWAAGT